jgi:uncharacterized DUF497 family protein
MDAPTFEWDPSKAAANVEKHGVTFEEAVSVFQDPLGKVHPDPDHSESEPRAILVGHSAQRRLLLVAFTERQGKIRVISARQVTRRERRDYEESQENGS